MDWGRPDATGSEDDSVVESDFEGPTLVGLALDCAVVDEIGRSAGGRDVVGKLCTARLAFVLFGTREGGKEKRKPEGN